MKQQLFSIGAGLALAGGALLAAGPVEARNGPKLVLHGCAVTDDDGDVSIEIQRGGNGELNGRRFRLGDNSRFELDNGDEGCGTITVQWRDGEWHVESVAVVENDNGETEVVTHEAELDFVERDGDRDRGRGRGSWRRDR